MNETLTTIRNRRSIRKFKTDQIDYAELQMIVDSALLAPNAANQQKWHFTVIQDKEMINRLEFKTKENMIKSGHEIFSQRANKPDYNTFYNAPTIILITAEEKNHFGYFDCGAAAQNIALAAEAQSIGSCVIGSSGFAFAGENLEELKKELEIPDGYAHVCTIALGYKEGPSPEAPPRKKEVVSYIR
jgi:nitroreductase